MKNTGEIMKPEDFKKHRIKLGFTQIELADKIGASRRAVQNWESGFRKIPLFVQQSIYWQRFTQSRMFAKFWTSIKK
jgi:DNA-binding XRE family transcriptional regulator